MVVETAKDRKRSQKKRVSEYWTQKVSKNKLEQTGW
jgi:hypothetical protein